MAPRIDIVGRRAKFHLDKHSEATWRLDIGTPRRYWIRRFSLKPSRNAYYDEVFEGMADWTGDRAVERALAGKVLSAMIAVIDPMRRGLLWFTVAATASVDNAFTEVVTKLGEWANRYGRQVYGSPSPDDDTSDDRIDDDENASIVKQIVILVGEHGITKPKYKRARPSRERARKPERAVVRGRTLKRAKATFHPPPTRRGA